MEFLTSLDNYNIFYEVAKSKNITRASEKLFISQPAVSQAIKKLEENLGVTLFVRSKKGIELSQVGQKIFDKIELALNSVTLAESLIDEEKGLLKGSIVLGAGSNVARKVLCQPISAFALDYPQIDVKIVEDVQVNMIEGLKNGSIDFVLTQKNVDISFPFQEMFETEYCFVKSSQCLSDRLVMLTEGSFAHATFKKFAKERGLQESPSIQVAGYKTALELVKNGVGITLVPKYIVEKELKEGSLTEVFADNHLPKICFGVYFNPQIMPPAAKVFVEYLKDRVAID